MATRDVELSRLTELELRYLRKALRYRLGRRDTPPSGYNTTTGISIERRHQLDSIADWILQEPRDAPLRLCWSLA